MATEEQLNALSATIALAASETTDGMEVTIQVVDSRGAPKAGVRDLEVWFSDSATSGAITGSTYSGALTATVGVIKTALTAKKHISAMTSADGILKLLLVASANPATEYVYVANPSGKGQPIISAASGTNWEGA